MNYPLDGDTTHIAGEATEMEKKRSKWKRRHSADSESNVVADRVLSYSPDAGGSLGKAKDCKMRRSSDGMRSRFQDDTHFELLNKSLQRSSSIRTISMIEEEGADHTDRLLNRTSFKNHSKSFIKHFPEISETEDLINAFTCALQKEVLYHGKMYVSQQHVCFFSSVLLKETKVQIHVSDIQFIKKKNTALVVPTAISIITNTGDKYLFGSLRNRDVCFQVVKSVCPQLQDVSASGSPQMASENDHDLEADTISNPSSQEDSADPHKLSDSGLARRKGSNVSLPLLVSNISHVEARNHSPSRNSTNRDGNSSEVNAASSWVTMVTEKIGYFLSMGGTTNINKLITVYLILALLLLLSSGYIGLRISALEEQLSALGSVTEFGLQRSFKET